MQNAHCEEPTAPQSSLQPGRRYQKKEMNIVMRIDPGPYSRQSRSMRKSKQEGTRRGAKDILKCHDTVCRCLNQQIFDCCLAGGSILIRQSDVNLPVTFTRVNAGLEEAVRSWKDRLAIGNVDLPVVASIAFQN